MKIETLKTETAKLSKAERQELLGYVENLVADDENQFEFTAVE